MAIVKIHVRDDHTATLVCPACGSIRQIAADRFRQTRHTVKVQCRCQQTFEVLFDFRRHYRKQVNLTGTYQIVGGGGGLITLNNVSRSGVGFTVSGLHRIEKGQRLQIEFNLNDKKKTFLKKLALVKSVRQNQIGCQFEDQAEMERDLGFFLQS